MIMAIRSAFHLRRWNERKALLKLLFQKRDDLLLTAHDTFEPYFSVLKCHIESIFDLFRLVANYEKL
jgi:hypothetical protein